MAALTGLVGSPITTQQADAILDYLDKDGSGSIQYDELCVGGGSLRPAGVHARSNTHPEPSTRSMQAFRLEDGATGKSVAPPNIGIETHSKARG